MYKLNQLVLLPCHEAIGQIVYIDKNKMVIRVSEEVNHKEIESYDVIVTPEGYIPHTKVTLIENIPFYENEIVYIKTKDGTLVIGKVSNFKVEAYANSDLIDLVSDFEYDNNKVMKVSLNCCEKLSQLKRQIDKCMFENKHLYECNVK